MPLSLDELLHLRVLLLNQGLQDLLLLVRHVLKLGLLLQLLLSQVELVHLAFKLAFLDFSNLLPRQHLVRVVGFLIHFQLVVGVEHVRVGFWELAILLQLLIKQHLDMVDLVLLLQLLVELLQEGMVGVTLRLLHRVQDLKLLVLVELIEVQLLQLLQLLVLQLFVELLLARLHLHLLLGLRLHGEVVLESLQKLRANVVSLATLDLRPQLLYLLLCEHLALGQPSLVGLHLLLHHLLFLHFLGEVLVMALVVHLLLVVIAVLHPDLIILIL